MIVNVNETEPNPRFFSNWNRTKVQKSILHIPIKDMIYNETM